MPDLPGYVRPEQRVVGGRQKAGGDGSLNERAEGDLDYLDIPAFLRRQAD